MDVREQYERLLWGTMDALGVSESVARKVLAAVGIQFGVSIAQATLSWITTGATTTALSALLLVGAAVAFVNTVLIVRRDVVDPLTELSTAAAADDAADQSESLATRANGLDDLVCAFEVLDARRGTDRTGTSPSRLHPTVPVVPPQTTDRDRCCRRLIGVAATDRPRLPRLTDLRSPPASRSL